MSKRHEEYITAAGSWAKRAAEDRMGWTNYKLAHATAAIAQVYATLALATKDEDDDS